MSIPPAAMLLLGIALGGSALALAGFVWAVATGQLDPGNAGGTAIFDEDERPQ
jgi:nitrogen fixation-related uncharacterized protein